MSGSDARTERLREGARRVLDGNWREGDRDGVRYAYTAPSPERYLWQWYWDSCFAAIAWRHLDPDRSRRELETVLAAAEPDGFIGHTIFWRGPVTWRRYVFYNVTERGAFMTRTIQPPLLALAWRLAVGDPSREPGIVRHHDWVERARDLEGDGLLWVLQPDETGLDASPQFDPVWGRRAHGLPLFPLLVRRNRRLAFDIRAVRAAGGSTWINAAWLLCHGLVRLGYHEPARVLAERVVGAVEREGWREYYDPYTGGGMGARRFAVSALALDLLDGRHRAVTDTAVSAVTS